jgi:hypothetical protein
MAKSHEELKLVLLIADNGPLSAMSAIGVLDWLLKPEVPVWITDQVFYEATKGSTTSWARSTEIWIAKNVRNGKVRIIDTPSGKNFRALHDIWIKNGRRDDLKPSGKNLGEVSIIEAMAIVEEMVSEKQVTIVLMDDRRGRVAMRSVSANVDLVSSRAFFKLLEKEFKVAGAASRWDNVIESIQQMDALDKIEEIRPEPRKKYAEAGQD